MVFVGAKPSNSTNFIGIGAFGLSTGVFANTYSKTTAYLDAGGAYWYNYPGYGFGFAASSTVNLDTCDFGEGSPDCLSRLCWHVDQGIGGYRAGCTTHLNNNENWRKVIYGGTQIYSCSPGMSHNTKTCHVLKQLQCPPQIPLPLLIATKVKEKELS